MNNLTRWRATWVDMLGRRRECFFDGPVSRGVARIDFQLKMVSRGERVPGTFTLDEVVPSMDEETIVLPIIRVRQEVLPDE